jgi:hypothetical protein
MESTSQTSGNTAQDWAQSAAQTIHDLKTKAQELGSTMTEQASNTTTSMGQGMNSLASTIRQQSPSAGIVGSAASTVANQLEAAGSYLQNNRFDNMARDLIGVVRRYPLPSLLLGFSFGYLWARHSER